MLQNLIDKYEQNSPFNILENYEDKFVSYLNELKGDTKKMAYLDLRINNPELKQKEIAKRIGVTPKTVCEWQKDSLFNRTVVELSESKYKLKRNEIIEILFEKAKEGDYKAVGLFLKYTDSKR